MSTSKFPAALRRPLLRLHFYAGILIAPFLLVAAVSGMLYAASYQIEDVLYEDLRTVEDSGGEPLPLTGQVRAVADAYPEASVTGVRPASEADESTQVLLDDGTVRDSGAVAVAFVDPYTGEVLGDSTTYGSSQAGPFREWVASLHRHLHLGEPGRVYSELAASWLWVVALGGVVLWLSRRKRPGRLWRPGGGATGRAGSLSWHAPVGMWLVLILLFLSVTGLTWSRYAGENVAALRAALDWRTPSLSIDAGEHAGHEGHGGHHDHGTSAFDLAMLDAVQDAAAQAGLEGPVEITLPADESGDFLVAQTQRSFPVRQDSAVVATADRSPHVTEELRFGDWPFMAQVTNVLIAAHMGVLFGLANQVLLFAAMAALVVMIVLGYRMWWQRRAKDAIVGRPYPRGALRSAPWRAVAVAVPVVAVVGWFMPLLGISLVAFLAVDILMGLWRRRTPQAPSGEGVTRRTAIGAATVTAAIAGGAGYVVGSGHEHPAEGHEHGSGVEPFFGEHQGGIATPVQAHALFASFDLAEGASAEDLRTLLADWSAVAEALSRGAVPPKAAIDGEDQFDAEAVAVGLDPARLTVTFGLGPALFAKTGMDAARPAKLEELPQFDGDQLVDAWCGGDLLLQICGDDRQVVGNAFLELRKRAVGFASLLWVQHGFSSSPDGGTPRNLLGFKDGSLNPEPASADFDARVWAAEDEPEWFAGGTYLVFRKIRMKLPDWSMASAEVQNLTFGRERDSGAPLSGGGEFDHPDFTAVGDDGLPAVPADSHVALTHEAAMFRRGYNYDYGFLTQGDVTSDAADHEHAAGTADHGHDEHPYDAGLLFTSFQADPRVFVDTQEKMAGGDRLMAFIVAEGSAVFAVPPGAGEGGFVAEGLFE